MKPRNFPARKLRRQLRAKVRSGAPISDRAEVFLTEPRDIRVRKGASGWASTVQGVAA